MILTECEFDAPAVLGDAATIIVIEAGNPADVENLTLYVEPCGGYSDTYSELYADATEGGLLPNAVAPVAEWYIGTLAAGSVLTIDSVRRVVSLEDASGVPIGGLDTLEFTGLWEWVEGSGGACIRVALDSQDATVNPDTTIRVDIIRREL